MIYIITPATACIGGRIIFRVIFQSIFALFSVQRPALCFRAANLGAIIGGGRRHVNGEQMTERVDGQMQLGVLLTLGAVIAGPERGDDRLDVDRR